MKLLGIIIQAMLIIFSVAITIILLLATKECEKDHSVYVRTVTGYVCLGAIP